MEHVLERLYSEKNLHRKNRARRYPVFRTSRCILCGRCVDVCPRFCLRMRWAAVQWNKDNGPQGQTVVILRDEGRCSLCGLCVRHCPAGAITMERDFFKE